MAILFLFTYIFLLGVRLTSYITKHLCILLLLYLVVDKLHNYNCSIPHLALNYMLDELRNISE